MVQASLLKVPGVVCSRREGRGVSGVVAMSLAVLLLC